MTPESLGNLADELLEIKANDKFADFCCGAGTVVADVVKKSSNCRSIWIR